MRLFRNHIGSKSKTKYKDTTKYLFHVEGSAGDGYICISQCISSDICDAIQMYRDRGVNVHKINRVIQVSADEECAITDFKKIREDVDMNDKNIRVV